jgi:hypothetical protein
VLEELVHVPLGELGEVGPRVRQPVYGGMRTVVVEAPI